VYHSASVIDYLDAVFLTVFNGCLRFCAGLHPDPVEAQFVDLLHNFLSNLGGYNDVYYIGRFWQISQGWVGFVSFYVIDVGIHSVNRVSGIAQTAKDPVAIFASVLAGADYGPQLPVDEI
jgi:hypothetical protein